VAGRESALSRPTQLHPPPAARDEIPGSLQQPTWLRRIVLHDAAAPACPERPRGRPRGRRALPPVLPRWRSGRVGQGLCCGGAMAVGPRDAAAEATAARPSDPAATRLPAVPSTRGAATSDLYLEMRRAFDTSPLPGVELWVDGDDGQRQRVVTYDRGRAVATARLEQRAASGQLHIARSLAGRSRQHRVHRCARLPRQRQFPDDTRNGAGRHAADRPLTVLRSFPHLA
jgi:hypothetical protein